MSNNIILKISELSETTQNNTPTEIYPIFFPSKFFIKEPQKNNNPIPQKRIYNKNIIKSQKNNFFSFNIRKF